MDIYTSRQRYPNNSTRRYQNSSMNFISNNIRNIVQKKISLEIIVILIIVCFILFVYSFSTIVYYWYFYTYTKCNEVIYNVPRNDASKDTTNTINYDTTDGRTFTGDITTDDKNVNFIYYNNIQPKEFLIKKNHPALALVPIILLCVSSFVLFMILFGTFHEWGIFFYVILLTTNTICVFSYLTYIMTRFRKATNWKYQIQKTGANDLIETKLSDINVEEVNNKTVSVYYSYNTTKDVNVITHVSGIEYDNNEYILYYDTTDLKNYIILKKTSFPPYFMPLLITCLLFFGLIMMCTLFLFLQ